MSQGLSTLAPPALLRLKTRPQFDAALAGRTLARTPHFVLHCAPLGPVAADPAGAAVPSKPLFPIGCVWLGAMVPKRWARRAVTRNAIKRQIYTLGQQYAGQLQVAAHVVRLRAEFDRRHFVSATSDALKAAVRTELHHLFERACATPLNTGA